MVKSKSNKMHLEINNDLELDVNNASVSRRNRKPKKSSSPIKRNKKVSLKLKTPKMMSSANQKMLAKKKRPFKRISAKRVTAFKSKPLMPFILINGKKVPLKAMKMSSSPKKKEVALFSASRKSASDSKMVPSNSRRKASTSRQEASSLRRKSSVSRRKSSMSRRKSSVSRGKFSVSRGKSSVSRRKFSVSRKKSSVSRRKSSVSRRKASASRKKASDARKRASASRRKASAARRKASFARLRDSRGRFTKKGTEGVKQSPTIYMPIQQASNGKTAEAIVVRTEKEANKAGVKDVKIVEK